MSGQINTGEPIRVRTPFRCQCFEVGGAYSIYTNREVRPNKKGEKRLRIKGNEVVIRLEKTVIRQIKKAWQKVMETIRGGRHEGVQTKKGL